MAVGEAYNVMNNVITRGANELFNYQHYVTRYAAFLSLYEAAMKNGGNIPATKAGSAYYKLKEINSYNPKKGAV